MKRALPDLLGLLFCLGMGAAQMLAASTTRTLAVKVDPTGSVKDDTRVEIRLQPTPPDANRKLPPSPVFNGTDWVVGPYKFIRGDRLTITARRTGWTDATTSISFEELDNSKLPTKVPIPYTLTLVETNRSADLKVTCNENDVQVVLLDPLRQTQTNYTVGTNVVSIPVQFHRLDEKTPWSTNQLRATKAGFEFVSANGGGTRADPEYIKDFTEADFKNWGGSFTLPQCREAAELQVPMRWFVTTNGPPYFTNSLVWSVRNPQTDRAVQELHTIEGNAVLAGRFSTIMVQSDTNHPGNIAMVELQSNPNTGQIDRSRIVLVTNGGTVQQLTTDDEPGVWYIQPCLAGNNADDLPGNRQYDPTRNKSYVYFASNRETGRFGIWRKPVANAGSYEPIDAGAPGFALEPTVYRANDDQACRVAFTRYLNGKPVIVVQALYGNLFGRTEPGHSPAWSPDGEKIAFVGSDGRLRVMDPSGQHVETVATESGGCYAPAWMPDSKHLVYAVQGADNFNLWMISTISTGGTSKQLTRDRSFDSFPAVSFLNQDSKEVFVCFLSNRGASTRLDAACWKLCYLKVVLE